MRAEAVQPLLGCHDPLGASSRRCSGDGFIADLVIC